MKETGPDLVAIDEARKMEIKRLASEEYEEAHDDIERTLLQATGAFRTVNYIKSQKEGAEERLVELLMSGAETQEIQKATADHRRRMEEFRMKDGTSSSVVTATRGRVEDFLKRFGLDKFVSFLPDTSPEEIQRVIDIGWEAKMYELSNRIES